MAGAITWTRFLFRRLKSTIVSFLKVPEMQECDHIKTVGLFNFQVHFTAKLNVTSVHFAQAMDKYERLALKLRDYESKKYGQWKAESESRLPLLMKRALLAVVTSEGRTQHDLVCLTRC